MHRLQEKEKVRIADEQVKELQRLRDLEKARLAEEEELKRLRVLDKTQKDRQQSEQPYRVRIAAEQAIERLPGKGAARADEETEMEHKCIEETDHIAAEEQESHRRHGEEEGARVEAQEQARCQEERIRNAGQGEKSQCRWEKQMQEHEGDHLPADKHCKVVWIAEPKVKKQPGNPTPEINKTPLPKPTNSLEASQKMNARVEEDDNDQQVVDVPESGEEEEEEGSEKESNDEDGLEAARHADSRKAANKKGRNKMKVNSRPAPSVGSAFGSMDMGPTPTPSPISTPPMVQFLPFHTHQPPSPYCPANTFRPLVMSVHTGYDGQPLYPPSFSPGSTINNFNSGNISNFSASNINSDNSTKSEHNFLTNAFITIANRPSAQPRERKRSTSPCKRRWWTTSLLRSKKARAETRRGLTMKLRNN